MREERIGLEHQPDPAFVGGHPRHVRAINMDGASGWGHQTGNCPHGGGLTATRGAKKSDQLALAHCQIEVGHGDGLAIRQGQILKMDKLIRHSERIPKGAQRQKRWRAT